MKLKILLILILIFFSLTPVLAGDFTSLNTQIQDTINNGDNILYLNEDYTFGENDTVRILVNTSENFTIEGNNHIIDGRKTSNVFVYTGDKTFYINNITISNGFTEEFGGAINTYKGTIIINNSKFLHNFAEINGGAIYSEYGNILIENSIFSSNKAISFAGAVNTRYGNLEIRGCEFINNTARTGGAVGTDGKNVYINTSKFYYNTADLAGALCTAGILSISNTILVNNTANQVNDLIAKEYINTDYNWYGNNTPFAQNTDRICTYYVSDSEYFIAYIPKNWRILSLETDKTYYTINQSAIITVSLNNYYNNISNTINSTNQSLKESKLIINNKQYNFTNTLTVDEKIDENKNITLIVDNQEIQKELILINTTETQIILPTLNFTYMEDKYLQGQLLNLNGNTIKGEKIDLKITRLSTNASKIYTLTTDNKGYFNLKINLATGEYNVDAIYTGEKPYNTSKNTTKITINKIKTTIETETFTHEEKLKEGYKFTGQLKTNNTSLTNQIIELKITRTKNNQSKIYQVETNENGEFSLEINLGYGIYSVECTYKGNNQYQISSTTTILNITL